MNLLDVLQAASNAAAQNVSGPLDLLSFGLRKAGVPVPENAVGSTQWMRERGLWRDVEDPYARAAGETLGILGPIVMAAKAPQIAGGLLQMQENAAKPGTIGKVMGRKQRGAIEASGLPDWIDDFKSAGGVLNPDGTVTVYHRTSEENAKNIRASGVMRGKEDGLFFASRPDGAASNYGETALEFRIPASQLSIDDIFSNEAHFRLPTKRALQSVRVKDWLVK